MKTQSLEIKVSSSDFDMILVTRQEVLWGEGRRAYFGTVGLLSKELGDKQYRNMQKSFTISRTSAEIFFSQIDLINVSTIL